MHLKNAIWSYRRGLLGQIVVSIHDNAHLHRAQLILTLLKNSQWELFEQLLYSPDLAPSDYHQFPLLKEALEGQHS